MELLCYEIQNDGAIGFEREQSTINLVVNQEGEESISFSPQRIKLHNCTMRNLDCKSDAWNQYFSIIENTKAKEITINSNKYQSIKLTKKKD
jgi:hypothetical protein